MLRINRSFRLIFALCAPQCSGRAPPPPQQGTQPCTSTQDQLCSQHTWNWSNMLNVRLSGSKIFSSQARYAFCRHNKYTDVDCQWFHYSIQYLDKILQNAFSTSIFCLYSATYSFLGETIRQKRHSLSLLKVPKKIMKCLLFTQIKIKTFFYLEAWKILFLLTCLWMRPSSLQWKGQCRGRFCLRAGACPILHKSSYLTYYHSFLEVWKTFSKLWKTDQPTTEGHEGS